MKMNNISNPDKINVGESIIVKKIVVHSTTKVSVGNQSSKNDIGK